MLSVKHGWGPYPAILAALATGAAIGLFQGSVSTQLAIPTFVVTLAGLLSAGARSCRCWAAPAR